NGRIGRIDPATGEISTIMTGEARDPHTMVLDGKGNIWFTSQGSNRVGRLNVATSDVTLVTPNDTPSNPYGIVLDGDGTVWVALLGAGLFPRIAPETLEVTRFELGDPAARSRRIAWTPDNALWYGDEARGMLGRLDPATKAVKEWPSPGGAESRPYALVNDDQGRIWYAESGAEKRLVGFDPKTEEFFANIPVSGTIRHMFFDAKTGALWFGTDANNLGRILTRGESSSD